MRKDYICLCVFILISLTKVSILYWLTFCFSNEPEVHKISIITKKP